MPASERPPPSALAPVPAAGAPPSEASPPNDASQTDDEVNQAIDANLRDHARYELVIRKFQQAVSDGDKAAVAALVDCPIAVTVDGKQQIVKDADAFVPDYDRILTLAIAGSIKAQRYNDLMVNYKGVMFGNGQAWINCICRDSACKQFDVKVVTIETGPFE